MSLEQKPEGNEVLAPADNLGKSQHRGTEVEALCDAEGTARRPVRLDWGWRWHGTEMGSERDKEARSCRV